MPIKFLEDKKVFKLDTASSSYIISLFDGGYLLNYYYGAKIPTQISRISTSANGLLPSPLTARP